MNITLKNIDPVNATLTVAVEKEDYQPQVQKALSDIRKNIVLDGFRKGNAPKSRIQALYGKSVLVDEINKLVSNKLFDYIKETHLSVLGEPLPSKTEQKPLDFDNQEDYEFSFDLALTPEMNVDLTKDDKLPYYNIVVEDEMIKKQIDKFKANYGTYEKVDSVAEKDMIKGKLIELEENGLEKENGIQNESAVLMPSFMKNETEKAKFVDAKMGDTIVFSPYKTYDGHEAELSSFLKIEKEEVANHQNDFSLLIEEITRYKEAELNQELFDRIYEAGTVTSEEDFKDKIKEDVILQLTPESDYKFFLDAKQRLEEKAKDIQFPDAFLKRWLLESNAERTEEMIEKDYPKILKDLKFQLIKNKIIKENKIQVENEEIRQQALAATQAQFKKYGAFNVSEDVLENFANEMLKKEESVRDLFDKILEEKLIAVLKAQVTLEQKDVTIEEFQSFFEKQEQE
jgi:trigger factor